MLATRFAALGSTVVIWDVNTKGLEETSTNIKRLGGKCHTFVVDVSDRKLVYNMASRVKEEVGVITILINNAGIVSGNRFLQLDDQKIVRTMEVNTFASFWTTKAFLPDIIARGSGHLVTTASIGGITGSCNLADYCASKFAVIGFMEALRYELLCDGHRNIHTTTVCPWFIDTGLFNGVKCDIIPLLQPEYVVDSIMAGILINQAIIFLPRMLYFLYFLKSFMPVAAMDRMFVLLKADTSMDTFTGRNGNIDNGSKTKSH
jgi:all-trans-retinol dehydrogenase (NAD+)